MRIHFRRALTHGQWQMLKATFLFGLMNVVVKYLERLPTQELVFSRALVMLIFCAVFLRAQNIRPWGRSHITLILRGVAGTVGLYAYFLTLKLMPLATAVTIQYMAPIFTILIASLFLKEGTRPLQWVFFGFAFAGVLLLKGFDSQVPPAAVLLGVFASICSALAYSFIRRLKDVEHELVVVLYFTLVTCVSVGPWAVTTWVMPEGVEWLLLSLLGTITFFAQIFMTKAYHLERSSNVSQLTYLGVIYAMIFGVSLFGEGLSFTTLLGMGLILFGVIMGTKYKTDSKVIGNVKI